jgi:hypothetical protein
VRHKINQKNPLSCGGEEKKKKKKRGKKKKKVKNEVTARLRALAAELYDIGIQNLVPRLKKCLDKGGDYVEK